MNYQEIKEYIEKGLNKDNDIKDRFRLLTEEQIESILNNNIVIDAKLIKHDSYYIFDNNYEIYWNNEGIWRDDMVEIDEGINSYSDKCSNNFNSIMKDAKVLVVLDENGKNPLELPLIRTKEGKIYNFEEILNIAQFDAEKEADKVITVPREYKRIVMGNEGYEEEFYNGYEEYNIADSIGFDGHKEAIAMLEAEYDYMNTKYSSRKICAKITELIKKVADCKKNALTSKFLKSYTITLLDNVKDFIHCLSVENPELVDNTSKIEKTIEFSGITDKYFPSEHYKSLNDFIQVCEKDSKEIRTNIQEALAGKEQEEIMEL